MTIQFFYFFKNCNNFCNYFSSIKNTNKINSHKINPIIESGNLFNSDYRTSFNNNWILNIKNYKP